MSILDVLFLISSKSVVVSLAICGAVLALAAPKLTRTDKSGINGASDAESKLNKICSKIGYSLTGLSVFLFIVAGFISDLK